MAKQQLSLQKQLLILKPTITTLFHNKDNIVDPITKGILQIISKTTTFIGKAIIFIAKAITYAKTNNNYAVS